MNHLLIHVHGFLSSSDAERVVALRKHIEATGLDVEVASPRLPDSPRLAVELIEKIIAEEICRRKSVALIGHSLGGYYATYLASVYQLKTVLVNPVVRGYEIMCEFFGEGYNPHSNEKFDIGEDEIAFLVSINLEKIPDHSLFMVMQQLGDEITDPTEAISYYKNCKLIVEEGGCHDFSNFEDHVGIIMNFLYG